jgi:hypothetical protein
MIGAVTGHAQTRMPITAGPVRDIDTTRDRTALRLCGNSRVTDFLLD